MTIKEDGKATTIREAAEIAGYSTTDTQLTRLRTNPHLQQWMREMMEDAGVSEGDVLKKFVELMEAKKVTRTTYKGDVDEHIDEDGPLQLAAARTLAELMGLFQKKNAGEDETAKKVTNILILSDKLDGLSDEELEARMARIALGLPEPEVEQVVRIKPVV